MIKGERASCDIYALYGGEWENAGRVNISERVVWSKNELRVQPVLPFLLIKGDGFKCEIYMYPAVIKLKAKSILGLHVYGEDWRGSTCYLSQLPFPFSSLKMRWTRCDIYVNLCDLIRGKYQTGKTNMKEKKKTQTHLSVP